MKLELEGINNNLIILDCYGRKLNKLAEVEGVVLLLDLASWSIIQSSSPPKITFSKIDFIFSLISSTVTSYSRTATLDLCPDILSSAKSEQSQNQKLSVWNK